MRRVLSTVILVGILGLGGSGVAAAHSRVTHACGRVHEPAFFAYINRIRATRVSCRTARKVARGYVRATSSSTQPGTGHTRQGSCFPSASYGLCTVSAAGRSWSCVRPHPTRRHPRPDTRCEYGLSRKWVRFNWV